MKDKSKIAQALQKAVDQQNSQLKKAMPRRK